MEREQILSELDKKPDVSVVIVGGGINGIGTFRDLALNDVDVLLVDQADFCSGASAASSHMAHGGVRYLENGEFRLVREAVRERNLLIQNAPHLVKLLPTTIPIFKRFSGLPNAPLKFLHLLDQPSERGALVIKIGLMLYDAYTGRRRTVPRHRFLNRRDSLSLWKELNPGIINTATYYDGLILQPERLAVELLLDAETANSQAHALNYVSFLRGSGDTVFLQDELTGSIHKVKPKLVVNATGAWIDLVNRGFGLSTRFIGGTKGSHLVLDHPELRAAIGDHEFFFENQDGRIVLILPLYDRVVVGSSDIPIEDPDEARCTEEEVDYFLGMVSRVFPAIRVKREHIVFRFSGVRPLAASTAKTAAQITRGHEIEVVGGEWTGLAFPVYSLVGGKWTSFRAFSEQVTDKTLAFLGRTRQTDTRSLAIGGGRGYPSTEDEAERSIHGISAWTGLPMERVRTLFERYGTRAEQVASLIGQQEDVPLKSLPSYSEREIEFVVRDEKVQHLDDFLLRRSMLAMLGWLSRQNMDEIAVLLGNVLGWDAERKKNEVERTLEILAERHGLRL